MHGNDSEHVGGPGASHEWSSSSASLGIQPAGGSSGRPTLQRRVQNALRWKSWGGEQAVVPIIHNRKSSDIGAADWAVPSAEPDHHRHRVGQSVGSDVELSSFSSGVGPDGSRAASGAGETPVNQTSDVLHSHGSYAVSSKSTGSSTGNNNHGSSAALGAAGTPAQQGPGSPAATAEDNCSVATQAGSTAHSFTSLYSMMTDIGDQGSDAGCSTAGLSTASGPAREASAAPANQTPSGTGFLGPQSATVLQFRGSDAGADEKASVSTLPLISESAYDEQQMLDDAQHLAAEQAAPLDAAAQDIDDYNPLQSISSKPRVSSSHGSITSSVSDLSAAAAGGHPRVPSPGYASPYNRSFHGSQRSSGPRAVHGQHHQQQLQDEALPMPFSTRRRPDNDETCSYATQAGSVHSASSILSSAFDAQRPHTYSLTAETPSASGLVPNGQQQQQSTHPLSVPDEAVSSAGDLDVGEFGVVSGSSAHSTVSTAPDTRAASDEQSPLGSSAAPCKPKNPADRHQDQNSYRSVTLKGAFRSVVAWGSGLGQRLQRVTVPGFHQQQQQQGARRQGDMAGACRPVGSSSRVPKGSANSQELANF